MISVKHKTKALLIQLLILGVDSAWSADRCNSVSISAKLTADQTFEQEIGGDLVFRIRPEKLGPEGDLDGWIVALFRKRSPQQDYIYPVNPPFGSMDFRHSGRYSAKAPNLLWKVPIE